MLIIIRKDEKLSLKSRFIIQLLCQNSSHNPFFVFKTESERFREKWYPDHVNLSSSTKGLLASYLIMLLRSPDEFYNALVKRVFSKKPKHVFTGKGFLSMLRHALHLYFGTSARTSRLMQLLSNIDTSKFFLIDEFISLNCLNLKKLRLLGPIIYVSQDIAYNRFDFGDSLITRTLMLNLERKAIANVDLIVACSEMEKLKYIQMGAKNVIFYPNIYPTEDFEPFQKDKKPSISIVLQSHWGLKARQSLKEIFNALAYLDKKVHVYLIGMKPKKYPRRITLEHHEFINSRLDYLKLLSKSWIAINVGIHKAGTNGRKYDYAEAGTVIFSDTLGSRGDLLPHEYTYIDSHDLAAKLRQLLEYGKVNLTEMGKANRKQVLSMAERKRRNLLDTIIKKIEIA